MEAQHENPVVRNDDIDKLVKKIDRIAERMEELAIAHSTQWARYELHCGNCPLVTTARDTCVLTDRYAIEQDDAPPSWCPLHKGDVIVRLKP